MTRYMPRDLVTAFALFWLEGPSAPEVARAPEFGPLQELIRGPSEISARLIEGPISIELAFRQEFWSMSRC
jgi:hypothetical protein